MEISTGIVDNVTQGYQLQTTRKGRTSAFSHHAISFTIDRKQAHFTTHYPPSLNPGDEVTIAAKQHRSGFNVLAFVNETNGTFGTYHLATFYWVAVVWLVIALPLIAVVPGLAILLGPFTILAAYFAYLGYRARDALKRCRQAVALCRAGGTTLNIESDA